MKWGNTSSSSQLSAISSTPVNNEFINSPLFFAQLTLIILHILVGQFTKNLRFEPPHDEW
ncbi:unnamed protein product [Haemonchus placei]|uniref:Uncharacterized protein n=1 Tax=Haemonchus placei TaxID=6290 RepID=A0A0N4XBS1_HAEPC|nr:unnamed protein product [Haemonchus placei]